MLSLMPEVQEASMLAFTCRTRFCVRILCWRYAPDGGWGVGATYTARGRVLGKKR